MRTAFRFPPVVRINTARVHSGYNIENNTLVHIEAENMFSPRLGMTTKK